MAALADLTVKKNDGTTDIVWTGVQPSSGDGVPAIWKSQTVGTAQAHQPEMRLSSRDSQNGASRTLRVTGAYMQIAVNTTTGVTSVINTARLTKEWVFSKSMPSADVNEFVSQFANLEAHATFKSYLKSGFSAS